MKKVIYGDKKFLILKITKGRYEYFTVVRKNMKRKYHAHFNSVSGARMIIKIYWSNQKPRSEYLLESLKRLCTKKELMQRNIYEEGKNNENNKYF